MAIIDQSLASQFHPEYSNRVVKFFDAGGKNKRDWLSCGDMLSHYSNCILVPTSFRTTAEEYQAGVYSYQYTGRGGLSWAIPCNALRALLCSFEKKKGV